jgi:hypothetical protein
MKIKLAAFLAILTAATSPFTGAADTFSEADITLRLEQIELDVALKQFEKVASALAEFSLEASLAESEDLPAEKLKELQDRRERRLVVLQKTKEELRAEIRERGAKLEKLRAQATHTRSANRSDAVLPPSDDSRAAPGTPKKADPFLAPSVPRPPSAPVTPGQPTPGAGVTPPPR